MESVGIALELETRIAEERATVGLSVGDETSGFRFGPEVFKDGVLDPVEAPGNGIDELRKVVVMDIIEGSKVVVDTMTTSPEVMVVVSAMLVPDGFGNEGAGYKVLGGIAGANIEVCEDKMPGDGEEVRVTRALDRLGGAILLSHCVVPLITE